jgi:hypothetical protein
MGYYTYYELSAKKDDWQYYSRIDNIDELFNDFKYVVKLSKINGKEIDLEKLHLKDLKELSFFKDYHANVSDDSLKWYEYEEDMRAISKAYPEYIFELAGSGEETGDIWRDYYKNGKRNRYYLPKKLELEKEEFDNELSGGTEI